MTKDELRRVIGLSVIALALPVLVCSESALPPAPPAQTPAASRDTLTPIPLSALSGATALPLEEPGAANSLSGSEVSVLVDGKSVQWAVRPRLSGNAPMVALRCLAGHLDLPLQWDSEARQVLVTRADGRTVVFPAVGLRYLIDGIGHYAGRSLMTEAGKMLVDLRLAARALDIALTWDPATGTADLDPAAPHGGEFPAPDPNLVAFLTFDDGPAKEVTAHILDVLAEYQVPATFFVVGRSAQYYPHLLRRMIDEGHVVGNHTMTHIHQRSDPRWIYASTETFAAEIEACSRIILEATGSLPVVARAPGGSGTHVTRGMRDFLKERGLTLYDWHVSTADSAWPRPTPDQMLENIIRGSREGTRSPLIILMHDGPSRHQPTADALPAIIEYLLFHGYRLSGLGPNTPGPG